MAHIDKYNGVLVINTGGLLTDRSAPSVNVCVRVNLKDYHIKTRVYPDRALGRYRYEVKLISKLNENKSIHYEIDFREYDQLKHLNPEEYIVKQQEEIIKPETTSILQWITIDE